MNGFTGVVKHIIILNAIIFFIMQTPFAKEYAGYLIAYYPFDSSFLPFQIVTHMFMHATPNHLIFNMLGLFFLGPFVERYVGQKNFFILYFACGLGAIAARYMMQYLGLTGLGPALGASGAVLGIVLSFATLFPNQPLQLLFIPIPIKAKYMAMGYLALDLFSGVTGVQSGVANWAHLGGAITGFLVTYFWLKQRR